jgi:sphingosine kinase
MGWMAPDANFFPAALISDGCMDLVTIDGTLSPITATKVLLAVETDKFFDNPHVNYRKVSAYRIIPRNQEKGCISIDGERVPFEPFQAEVQQGLGRVITKRGIYEGPGPLNWESAKRS